MLAIITFVIFQLAMKITFSYSYPINSNHGSVILSKTFRQPGDNGKGEDG